MNDRRRHEIPAEALDRLVRGRATAEERASIVRHLFARCPSCCALLHEAGWPAGVIGGEALPAPVPSAYDEAFAAAEKSVLAILERRPPPVRKLLAELERLPVERQEMRVRNGDRFASVELAWALIAKSHEVRFADGTAMLQYARLAVAAAEGAAARAAASRPATEAERSRFADCCARAWGQLANAQRASSALRESEQSFATAVRHLLAGTGDPELRAWLLRHLSSLRVYQRAFAEAIALLTECVELYRRLGDAKGEASALMSLSLARIYSGDAESALPELLSALELLAGGDADLVLAATCNLLLCYIELGRPLEAYDLVAAGERQLKDSQDELAKLRWHALCGVVDRDLGLFGAGEIRLIAAREGFLERDRPFEVALVSLELANLYARQRRGKDVVRMVADAVPILQSLGATRDVLAALMQLREVAHQRRVAVALAQQLVTQLRPGLPQAAGMLTS